MLLSMASLFAQDSLPPANPHYQSRRLQLEEVDFVTGYYQQTGDHAASTGGIGSEALKDLATSFDVRLTRHGRKLGQQHTYQFHLGVDGYTSASSDKIDPNTVTSASYSDIRVSPSLGWTLRDANTRWTYGAKAAFSTEYDYLSTGLGLEAEKQSKDLNRSLQLKANVFLDFPTLILPIEFRRGSGEGLLRDPSMPRGTQSRNSYSLSLAYTQLLTPRLQMALVFEPTFQQGFLSTSFNRIFFQDGRVGLERLPDTRLKLPVALRLHAFVGDWLVLRSYYRYYQDDWGLHAHTLNLEAPIKVTPFLSLSPFYRYYRQTGIDYFAPYGEHLPTEAYYSSDYDLSSFAAHFYGMGVRYFSAKGLLGIYKFALSTIELRAGRYQRTTGLEATSVSLAFKFSPKA